MEILLLMQILYLYLAVIPKEDIKQEQSQTSLDSAEREKVRADRKQQTRERIDGRIATLRRLRGLTQEQLAQEAGLQRTHVNRIEAGKYAVTIDVVQAIAHVLGMTVDLIDPALQDLAPLRKLNTDK